jgi:hypothetical protein
MTSVVLIRSFEALLRLSIWHFFKNRNGKIYMFGEYGFDGQASYPNHIPHTPHLRHQTPHNTTKSHHPYCW